MSTAELDAECKSSWKQLKVQAHQMDAVPEVEENDDQVIRKINCGSTWKGFQPKHKKKEDAGKKRVGKKSGQGK